MLNRIYQLAWYMSYSYMRILVFFDLPTKTKKDRRIYSLFRKALIKRGYFMIQFSIYAKILANRDASNLEKDYIKKIVPERGNIRIMIVTEKQYSKMEIIVGGKSNQEKLITEEVMIII